MTLRPITNNVSFKSMGKIAYQTKKVYSRGLPFFRTVIKKGGIERGEINRCKELGNEAVYGYTQHGQKVLYFQSFFNSITRQHAISMRYKNIAKNLLDSEPVSLRCTIPWKVNDKKIPSIKDFFKMLKKSKTNKI